MCDCKKNQTHDDVFAFLKESKINPFKTNQSGIGMFMIPAPEIGVLEYKIINVPDLNYRETVKRGETCKAFQWLPYGIHVQGKNKSMQINNIEDFESLEIDCNDSCRGGCPMNGCFCYQGESYCHRR
jgi:hypothetical protein